VSNLKIPKRVEALEKAADELIKYLNKCHNTHVKVIVTPTSVELLTSDISIQKVHKHLED